MKGRAEVGDESAKIVATEILPLSACIEDPFGSIHFKIPPDLPESAIEDLKSLISNNPGKSDAYVHISITGKGETVVYLGKDMRVNISSSLKDEADKLISPGVTVIK